MPQMLYRPTFMQVNLQAIQSNIQQMQQMLPVNTELIAVVKANAYGHGDIEVAKAALK